MDYLIRAYTQLNLGDDLFIHTLCKRYPNHNFHLVCKRSKSEPFKNIKNLKIHFAPELMDSIFFKLGYSKNIFNNLELKLSKECDGVIHIGGSIFIESKNWELAFNRTKNIISNSKSYFILGSNFGPFESDKFKNSYISIFEEANDICFRDDYSYNLFSDLNNVRYAPDVVLTLDTSKYISNNDSENRIVISVINLKDRENLQEFHKLYIESIVSISKALIDRGVEVILMGFCNAEKDHIAIKEIQSKINSDAVKVYNYNGNIDEAINILKSAKSIVASRFHAMILGWLMDKNVLPLVYSNKSLNVIKDVNFEGYYCEVKNIQNFDVSKSINQLLDDNFLLGDEYRNNAHKQFLALDRLFNE